MRTQISVVLLLLMITRLSVAAPESPEKQFDFLGFIKSAYSAYTKVKNFFDPDPNLADLILQAKNEIIEEINLVRAEEQIGNVNALIDEYAIYLNNPPTQQTIEAWIRDAINVLNQFEIIISEKSPYIAYLSAKAYNMLIPLLALMMQRSGIRTEDILPLFNDAIETNKVLIGEYCWDELPNAPLYWERRSSGDNYVGKLLKCYDNGDISWMEYLVTYDIVWSANEEMRRNIIVRYDDVWFYISNEKGSLSDPVSPGDNKYLYARTYPNRTYAQVELKELQPDDSDFLWKLEFQTAKLVKFRHWSGKYLVMKNDSSVILAPAPLSYFGDTWNFGFWYPDRPSIYINDAHLTLQDWGGGTVRMWPPGYTPGASERWVIQYATRKGFCVGSTAFPAPGDYDGDGKADLGMKMGDGRWLIDYADNGFGNWDQIITYATRLSPATQVACGDFDGDGKTDIAIQQNELLEWDIDYAANGFGDWDYSYDWTGTRLASCQAVPGDYDGDGKTDVGILNASGGWTIDYSGNGFGHFDTAPHAWEAYYPQNDFFPSQADYDGDGKTDVSIKTDQGQWLVDYAENDFVWSNEWDFVSKSDFYVGANIFPVPGDFNGDGHADIAIRHEQGRWAIWDISQGFPNLIHFTSNPAVGGGRHTFPIPADYDGDGITDISVIDEDGTWYIDYSANGFSTSLSWDWSSAMPMLPTSVRWPHGRNSRTTSLVQTYCLGNYPNPFNSSTTIYYSLAKSARVSIKIYDLLGRKIATLFDGVQTSGEHTTIWDGRNSLGREVASGVYFYRLEFEGQVKSGKMVLMR